VYKNIPIQKTPKQQIVQETPKAKHASEKTASKTKRQSDEDQLVTAPMPGTILDIKVSEGHQ
jgi:biotin carboxyl carrier protein